MLRYLLKNILNYGKSYVIIFTLMILMACVLSFFIALGRAYSDRAVEYSRAMGDVDISYTVFDRAEITTSASEIMEFSENVLQAEQTIGFQGDGGILFSESFSSQVTLMPLDIMQEFDIFQLLEGTLPDDYSVLVPRSFAEDNEIAVGEHLTFVYNNMDGVVDSIIVTVSGTYALGDDNFPYSLVSTKKTHTEFFGEQDDWFFTIYLPAEIRAQEYRQLNERQSKNFENPKSVMPVDTMQEFESFRLIEGTLPDDFTILISDVFAKENALSIGNYASFALEKDDAIADSLIVKISGIFTMDGDYPHTIVSNEKRFADFFGKMEDHSLLAILPVKTRGEENPLLSESQFYLFSDLLTQELGDDVAMHHTSKYYYDRIHLYLFFFYFLILIMIGILSLLAVSTIMNVTHTIFTNRLPDVGVFFTFGFSVKKIAVLFSAELLCLFVLATSIGLGISHILSQYIASIKILPTNVTLKILLAGSNGLSFLYDAPTYAMTLLCCVILPFIFSYIYMRKKSGHSVVSFLRSA